MKYNVDDVVVRNWANLRQMPDGRWNRIWEITLKQAIPESINLENISKLLSHEDFDIRVVMREGNNLAISVTTERWGWEDELIFATYRMFEEIEHLVGKIDIIQAQNRDIWHLQFQTNKLKSFNAD
ncbi:hypothetical protein Osc7112_6371 (plasmid) [Oscillatoria nigro-viridis PCC 7112]|uniref:Uncharacterized protein n=1 Tax=Phormidium nigroviride PCC 7112 TaxID=179408 RepID=K9VRG7_9CYAN|nr:hypothetical protein [Oscillatoria nigro-viridis]AFZ10526.1 hypothetical protein Osc7112_6371 [Oscillatoria nigro-viridis PCC 7112]